MAPPVPPANVLPFLQSASAGTGIPLTVVEAQNQTESDYGRNQGPSSAGARGPWQFLPSTYQGLGFNVSTITDWNTSTQAYVKYMDELLAQEGGSVFKALEAYNAGPGNLPAGAGYASSILKEAGASQNITSSGGTGKAVLTSATTSNPSAAAGFFGGLLGTDPFGFGALFQGIVDAFLGTFGIPNFKDGLERLGLIILGAVMILVGFNILAHGSGGFPGSSPLTKSEPESEPESTTESEPSEDTSSAPSASQGGSKRRVGGGQVSEDFQRQYMSGKGAGAAKTVTSSEAIEAAAVA